MFSFKYIIHWPQNLQHVQHTLKCRTNKGDNLTTTQIHLNTEFCYLIDKILMFKNGSHILVNPLNIQRFKFKLTFRMKEYQTCTILKCIRSHGAPRLVACEELKRLYSALKPKLFSYLHTIYSHPLDAGVMLFYYTDWTIIWCFQQFSTFALC
jgi:hypothetical protein